MKEQLRTLLYLVLRIFFATAIQVAFPLWAFYTALDPSKFHLSMEHTRVAVLALLTALLLSGLAGDIAGTLAYLNLKRNWVPEWGFNQFFTCMVAGGAGGTVITTFILVAIRWWQLTH
ncbi:MAG: hypothetical protein IT567_05405 [Alphaproteobacteria bacterium]|nr:hypothetical protein [Alphaproteobacteria bacterium]